MSQCLNKQSSEYANVINMPGIVHNLGSMYKVPSTYCERHAQNLSRQLRWNFVEEKLHPLTNFVKPFILDV